MDKYLRTSTAVSKLLSKRYGIHTPSYTFNINNSYENHTNYDTSLLQDNLNKDISIGCLRCVGEWIAAASELIKTSTSANLGNLWETDLGRDLAQTLITRRLAIGFTDFYELLKFFALIKDDRLQILPQLLNIQLKSFSQSEELSKINPSKLLNMPLLINMSNIKIDSRTFELLSVISEHIKRLITKDNSADLKLPDIVSFQIGIANLGFADQDLLKLLNSKLVESSANISNPCYFQLYNIALLANASCFSLDIDFYSKIIALIIDNLNLLPLSHITTHVLSRAIISNIYTVENSETLKAISKNYEKMTLEDKITLVWSMLSLGMDKNPEFTEMLNDVFTPSPNVNITQNTKNFLDQIYITAKADGYLPSYSVVTSVKSFTNYTCDGLPIDRLANAIKRLVYNGEFDCESDCKRFETRIPALPYYDFNAVIPTTNDNASNDFPYNGIAITLYKQLNNVENPLLWDPFYTIRRKNLMKIGYKDVYLPINWTELSHTQLANIVINGD